VGRLDRQQGIKDAIWSADLLKVVRDDTYLLIFGSGRHRWRLERFRRQTHTEDRVCFLHDADPWPVISHLTCLWQPQRQPAELYALLYAMARGVPVVATDLPGHRRLLEDGQTGFLIRVGHRAGLARRTQLLLKDPELRGRIGRQSRAAAQQRFSLAEWLEAYQNLYVGCR
jgi:glycosyltransferase involved in cell wall biosynthesis